MDSSFILFLAVVAGLATIFGILYYKFKDYSPHNEKMKRLKRIRKMRVATASQR